MVESSAIEPDSKVSSPFQTTPRARSPSCAAAPNFLSDRAASTEIDGIRGSMPLEKPGIITFLAGRPNPTTFPFESITLNIKPPLDGRSSESVAVQSDGEASNEASQYGPSAGLSSIRGWLTDSQAQVHKREIGENWAVSSGSGSQDSMSKCFQAVSNPGDPISVETPVYSGVSPTSRQSGAKCIEVDVDDEGLSADRLAAILDNWSAGEKKPRVIYSTPVGCNPSGCSSSAQRKLDVLQVMKKHDSLMMEDDPYYYLTTPSIPSYFELEKQVFPEGGHVVRFDSFSKLSSAGIRLGFATGPKDISHAIDVHTAGANSHTSALAQAIAHSSLSHWGIDGFLAHSRAVSEFYRERRDRFEATARKELGDLATWVSPVAGMFLWIDSSPGGIEDSYKSIRNEALAKGVLAVPGAAFYPSGRKSPHVRVSFSVIDLEDESPEGFRRLAEAIRDKRKELGLE